MDGQRCPEQTPQRGVPEVLLCGECTQVPGPKGRYALSLTATHLHLQWLEQAPESPGCLLSLADCIGCCAFKGRDPADPGGYFSVFWYPLKKKWWRSLEARQREAKTFRLETCRDPKENLKTAERWAEKIRELSVQRIPKEEEGLYSCLPQPRQLLVLVNPHGGKGEAQNLFYSQILPMLVEANIGFNLVVTDRQNQARELMRDEDLSRWDAVVIVSGDGLVYEVVNGLMERPDWKSAIKKPVGILPGGSGNGLAAAINHYAGNDQVSNQELLTNCTFFLCKGLVAPMDLVSFTTGSGKCIFSFLSFAWGFVSDVDIESEKYRMMGHTRFTVGTLVRLSSLRTYKGRLAYLRAEEASNQNTEIFPNPSSSSTATSHQNCQKLQPNFCNDTHQSLNANVVHQITSESSVDEISNLIPLDQPVPNHWTVVKEEEFVLILAIYQSHLGTSYFTAPMVSRPDDSLIHLFYVRSGISRTALLKFFLAMEKGNHLEHSCPHLVYMPVKAFRLEPFTNKGIMTIDGEALECGPIQGQLHSRLARIISGSKK
ncbi:sphingosine kinase 1 [Rhinatrema bivittatum]|uniref:sphingosine kinase 1 n=1 Tax=Rhinatrema bivittatum TaxID=194408 RepID=UPI001127CFA3|nr:sphingosine kinase 1 [Rhinatrema bivittatum]